MYLIHFDRPYGRSSHYVGWAPPLGLRLRITKHRQGAGARTLRRLNEAGIGWNVVRIWTGATLEDEQKVKAWKRSKLLCPTCSDPPLNYELKP